MFTATMDSPLGALLLTSDGTAITGLRLDAAVGPAPHQASVAGRGDPGPFTELFEQLAGWFAGERTSFDLPLAPAGTAFQLRVWRALLDIPYAQSRSYGAVAAAIGEPAAVRAVGAANGRNPIAIIIPCHRVIGADGSLTGYGGGLPAKKWLLHHERAVAGFEAPALF